MKVRSSRPDSVFFIGLERAPSAGGRGTRMALASGLLEPGELGAGGGLEGAPAHLRGERDRAVADDAVQQVPAPEDLAARAAKAAEDPVDLGRHIAAADDHD